MFVKVGAKSKKYLIASLFVFFSIFSASHCYAVSVGDSYGGGTVFCVSQTADTTQCVTTGSGCYGLIMANTDQVNYDSNPNHGINWSSSAPSATGATSLDNGATNTATIIAAFPSDNSSNNAAWAAHNYIDSIEGHTDWYLPSKNELNKMYAYANANNLIGSSCTGSKMGGVQCLVGSNSIYGYNVYWSSSEYSSSFLTAWYQAFGNGNQDVGGKTSGYFGVRAVRAFSLTTLMIYQFTKTGYEDAVLSFTASDFTNHSTDCSGGTGLSRIKVLSLPANGILKFAGSDVSVDQEIDISNIGNLTYVPTSGWTGSTSFSWTGSNGIVYAVSPANVNITIDSVPPSGLNVGTIAGIAAGGVAAVCATTAGVSYWCTKHHHDIHTKDKLTRHGAV